MRRWVYAWMVGALVSAPFAMSAATEVVSVEGGAISGVVDRGVRVFKGIPYAAPPVGQLRWKPPQPVIAVERHARRVGVRRRMPADASTAPARFTSARCNHRARTASSSTCGRRRSAGDTQPVFVWIHGGALTKGSGISDVRDGVPLARKGVVLVSLNYRLGALGYLGAPRADRGVAAASRRATTACSIRLRRCSGCSATSRRLAAIRRESRSAASRRARGA